MARSIRYNIMLYNMSVTSNRLVSSTNTTDRHDIIEILLKVALKTINLNPNRNIIYCVMESVLYIGEKNRRIGP